MTTRKNQNKNSKSQQFRSIKSSINNITDISLSPVYDNQIFSGEIPLLSTNVFSNTSLTSLSSISSCTVTNGSSPYSYIKKCIGIKLKHISNSDPIAYEVDKTFSTNKIDDEFINLNNIIKDFKNYTFEVFAKAGRRITDNITVSIQNGYAFVLDESIPGDTIGFIKKRGDITSHGALFLNCYIYNGKIGFENTIFNGDDGIILPKGTTSQRGDNVSGKIRYNTQAGVFECYTDNEWITLGTVKHLNGYTYISPEDYPGRENRQLKFFVKESATDASNLTMIIHNNGNVGVNLGTNNPTAKLDINGSIDLNNGNITAGNGINWNNVTSPQTEITSDRKGVVKIGSNLEMTGSDDFSLTSSYSSNQTIDWTAQNAGSIHDSNIVTYSQATTSALGTVKLGYNSDTNTTTYNSYAGTNHPLKVAADGQAFIMVPWNRPATSSQTGLIKIGYTENGKNYPVELDANDRAYVNVPWTDTTYPTNQTIDWTVKGPTIHASNYTNTQYQIAGSNLGLIKIGYTENGKNYPVKLSSGKAYVNVPWTDTTYTANQTMNWVTAGGGSKIIHPDNYVDTVYGRATAQADNLGLMQLGYTENGKNYPVYATSDGTLAIDSGWTDGGTNWTANQTIDWTVSQTNKTIHSDNYYKPPVATSSTAGVLRTNNYYGWYQEPYIPIVSTANSTDAADDGKAYISVPQYTEPWSTTGWGNSILKYSNKSLKIEGSSSDTEGIHIDRTYTNAISNTTINQSSYMHLQLYRTTDTDISNFSTLKTSALGTGIRLVSKFSGVETYSSIRSYMSIDNYTSPNYMTDDTRHGSTFFKFQTTYGLNGSEQEFLVVSGAGDGNGNGHGNVGIGDETPLCPLTVKDNVTDWKNYEGIPTYNNKWGYLHGTGIASGKSFSNTWPTSSSWTMSAFFEQGLYVGTLQIVSDRRIKEDIVDFSDNYALELVKKIKCKKYNYLDKTTTGPSKVIGFIAQNVNDVLPNAINFQTEFIPDKQQLLNSDEFSWEEYLDPSDNELKYLLNIYNYDVSANTHVKFHLANNKKDNNDISGVDISGNVECITSISRDDGKFLFDSSYDVVFIYGKLINDLHRVDKDKIYALHHSAIQEIDRQQQQHENKISLCTSQTTNLEVEYNNILSNISDLLTRVESLEQQ